MPARSNPIYSVTCAVRTLQIASMRKSYTILMPRLTIEGKMTDTQEANGVILIVDDSKANLELLSDYLRRAGFKTMEAINGEYALKKVEYKAPDLILLDVLMPGIDGFETCKRLKASPFAHNIPVIFMSALSDTIDKVKGFSLGAVDYIAKPFQEEELLARVGVHLKLRSLTQTLETQNITLKQEITEREAAEAALKKEIADREAAEASLQQLTIELEKRVDERTSELKQALKELQQAQLHMVQAEKMSSLGQLVAGVAHEINNPVGFICNNLAHAKEYSQDMIRILHLYQQHYPNPEAEIREELEAVDMEFLVEDLPEILESMNLGTERIRNISLSLRNFSRSDASNRLPVNVHDGIESTLLILGHRLKANSDRPKIEVIKNYGDLPEVPCYPGLLNQVFMNVIANAIDALEIGNGTSPAETENSAETIPQMSQNPIATIRISSELVEDCAIVRIADNGPGIPEQIRSKLFEPMFTTKPIGQGTGLGLSISRDIVVEKHGGKLKCVSAPGQGTVFIIEIPLESVENQSSQTCQSESQTQEWAEEKTVLLP